MLYLLVLVLSSRLISSAIEQFFVLASAKVPYRGVLIVLCKCTGAMGILKQQHLERGDELLLL